MRTRDGSVLAPAPLTYSGTTSRSVIRSLGYLGYCRVSHRQKQGWCEAHTHRQTSQFRVSSPSRSYGRMSANRHIPRLLLATKTSGNGWTLAHVLGRTGNSVAAEWEDEKRQLNVPVSDAYTAINGIAPPRFMRRSSSPTLRTRLVSSSREHAPPSRRAVEVHIFLIFTILCSIQVQHSGTLRHNPAGLPLHDIVSMILGHQPSEHLVMLPIP